MVIHITFFVPCLTYSQYSHKVTSIHCKTLFKKHIEKRQETRKRNKLISFSRAVCITFNFCDFLIIIIYISIYSIRRNVLMCHLNTFTTRFHVVKNTFIGLFNMFWISKDKHILIIASQASSCLFNRNAIHVGIN